VKSPSRWVNLLLAIALAMVLGAAAVSQQWFGFVLCLGAAVFTLSWAALLNRTGVWVICSMIELLIMFNAYFHFHRAMLPKL
jgi:hypothetical protein